MKTKNAFLWFANTAAHWTGTSIAFFIALAAVVIWLVTGPAYHYSDTWQLVINTGTTIITFLMVFLIQNTQNRDGRALQLKLDELIRSTEGAHTLLLDIEKLNEDELEAISQKYYEIAKLARERVRSGKSDTDIPDIIMDAPLDIK
jgi:low affinity Fe/Cu permease